MTVVRFLGTTPQSSIFSLLNSVCAQIARNYDITFQVYDVISELVQRMGELLRCASAKQPLVLFLDSLDQLPRKLRTQTLLVALSTPATLPRHCVDTSGSGSSREIKFRDVKVLKELFCVHCAQ